MNNQRKLVQASSKARKRLSFTPVEHVELDEAKEDEDEAEMLEMMKKFEEDDEETTDVTSFQPPTSKQAAAETLVSMGGTGMASKDGVLVFEDRKLAPPISPPKRAILRSGESPAIEVTLGRLLAKPNNAKKAPFYFKGMRLSKGLQQGNKKSFHFDLPFGMIRCLYACLGQWETTFK